MLQGQKLLVEQCPQARQFIRVAQFLGGHHLVELAGIGLVVDIHTDAARIVRHDQGRLVRVCLGAEFLRIEVRIHFHQRRFAVGGLVGQALVIDHHVVRIELRVALRILVARLGFVLVVQFLQRILQFRAQAEIGDDLAADGGEPALVVQATLQRRDVVAGVLLDMITPELDEVFRRRRQFAAGQVLPDQQADGHRQGRFGYIHDAVEFRLAAVRLKGCLEVLRHALEAPRTDGGDARILDPLEHFLGGPAARRETVVHGLVVEPEFQRKFIADAAHRIDFRIVATHGGQRHAHPVAAQHGGTLAEGDLDLVVFRNGPHRGDGGALEGLQRMFQFDRHGAGCAQAVRSVMPAVASPRSSPMQRW